MKKLTALFAALTIAVCAFTACDDDKKSSGSDSSKPETVTTEPATLPADSDAEKKCTEILNSYFDALNNGDIKKTFAYQYDDDIIEAVAALSNYQSVDEMYKNFENSFNGLNLQVGTINSVQPITDYQYGYINEIYGRFCSVQYIIDRDGGINKTTLKHLQEIYADEELYKEYKLDFKEGYYIVGTIKSDAQGEVEQRIMVYRTDEDNWKVDMTVAGYIDECEDYAIDHIADEVASTATTLLEKDTSIADKMFIIGCEKDLDVNVPDGFDADAVRKHVTKNCEAYNGGKFFIFVKEGRAYYTAYADDDEYTGTNPYGLTLGEKDGGIDYAELDRNKSTFDEIYSSCADVVKQHS